MKPSLARPPARASCSYSQHRPKTSVTSPSHPTRPPSTVSYTMSHNSTALRSSGIQESARAPSPNYFALTVDPESDPRDSGIGPRGNWSPPTSSIRSFSTQSPRQISVDANSEFEAFRKQTEANGAFSLSHGNLSYFNSTPGPTSIRRRSGEGIIADDPSAASRPAPNGGDVSPVQGGPSDHNTEPGPARGLPTVKSQVEAPRSTPSYFGIDMPRQESPPTINPAATPRRHEQRNALSNLDDRHPRLSLPSNKVDPPSPNVTREMHHRADTLPLTLEDGPVMIKATELKDILQRVPLQQFLLLDLRVSPQFSQFRIKDALNLCIPTTLLKRPSFNLEKLTDTFKDEKERARFSQWRDCRHIIVYDAHSREKKDATSALNTLRKFTSEGWNGRAYILRGGISEFSRMYPQLVQQYPSNEIQSSRKLSLASSMTDVAPIAGGCAMPSMQSATNPFFGNIRQNMDLIGGVGQIDVTKPEALADGFLPQWLREAAAPSDHGKTVADKFLRIEQDELSRMQRALSSMVSYGTPESSSERSVQIAGFEKGGKNRYNNIWPFEHARVRLQGRPEGACDYVNASHIKAAWSNKRYIASQGPLPSTFEDFWSVVWDQDVRVIIMLTAESEGGQLKCHPYWAAKEYGAFRLKALSERKVSLDLHKHRISTSRQDSSQRRANTGSESSPATSSTNDQPFVVIRKFTLSHTSEPFSPMREIAQLHYGSWPDFGAPAQPSQLLSLVELSNSLQRMASALSSSSSPKADGPEDSEDARPLLVHCSAGCGRTGTFCTVDSVIDMLRRQRREQRSGVTPMETRSNSDGDYIAKGGETDMSDDWIFNEEYDLIQRTVEDFRQQRISMVQSLRQYVLCYETVLEWVSQQQQACSRQERSGSESRAN